MVDGLTIFSECLRVVDHDCDKTLRKTIIKRTGVEASRGRMRDLERWVRQRWRFHLFIGRVA